MDDLVLHEYFVQLDGEDFGCPPHPTENYMLGRASVFIANADGVVKESCLPFHAQSNGEDLEMLVLLEEYGKAVLMGFDDVEGQFV